MTPEKLIAESERLLTCNLADIEQVGRLTDREIQLITMRAALGTGLAALAQAQIMNEAFRPIVVTSEANMPVTAKCGHDEVSLKHGDHWLHPFTLNHCDRPPVTP